MTEKAGSIRLRGASEEDSDFLFSLRNDPVVIAASSSGTGVQVNEHVAWLNRVIKSEMHVLNIIESTNPIQRIGSTRLDKQGQSDAVISVAILEGWRNRSLGQGAIIETARRGFEHWSDLRRVLAYIRVENAASVAAFSRVGFRLLDSCERGDHQGFSLDRSSMT